MADIYKAVIESGVFDGVHVKADEAGAILVYTPHDEGAIFTPAVAQAVCDAIMTAARVATAKVGGIPYGLQA